MWLEICIYLNYLYVDIVDILYDKFDLSKFLLVNQFRVGFDDYDVVNY